MDIEEIKSRILYSIPIENYVSRFVNLKKQGRYLVGLCPFHKEKTPSFTITPEKGIFYCFGCGRGGNLISFVIEKENVTFKEALEILANYAGLKIDYSSQNQENKYIKILENIHQEYKKILLSEEGKAYYEYLVNRGLNSYSITKFQLGAVTKDNLLTEKFQNYLEELYHLGMIKKSKDNQYYDFFKNRILFPIFNIHNHVVGFGGRVIDDSKPKYINSPESYIFHKGSLLYGLNFALPEIKKKNQIIITEGYLDVIGLHQIGIENVVAPLGTAFTVEHKKQILRYSKNIILMFDGDNAGRNSAFKTLLLFWEEINNVRILLLPEDTDPFDLSIKIYKKEIHLDIPFLWENTISGLEYLLFYCIILDEDKEEFFNKINKDIKIFLKEIQVFFTKEKLSLYFNNLEFSKKQQSIQNIKELLHNFSNEIFKEMLIHELINITKIDLKNFFKDSIKNFSKNPELRNKNLPTNIDKNEEILYLIERELIAILLNYPQMIKSFFNELNQIQFYDEYSEFMWRIMYERSIIFQKEIVIREILSLVPVSIQKALVPYILNNINEVKNKEVLSDNEVINIIQELLTKHKIEEVNKKIKKKQEELNLSEDENKMQLYYEINKLLKEKKMLTASLRSSQ